MPPGLCKITDMGQEGVTCWMPIAVQGVPVRIPAMVEGEEGWYGDIIREVSIADGGAALKNRGYEVKGDTHGLEPCPKKDGKLVCVPPKDDYYIKDSEWDGIEN